MDAAITELPANCMTLPRHVEPRLRVTVLRGCGWDHHRYISRLKLQRSFNIVYSVHWKTCGLFNQKEEYTRNSTEAERASKRILHRSARNHGQPIRRHQVRNQGSDWYHQGKPLIPTVVMLCNCSLEHKIGRAHV